MLAYFLHHFSPFVVEFGNGIGIRWYGLMYVLGFLAGYVLYKHLAERGYTDMPPANVSDFITWCAVFGVMLGGRLGWIIFYGWPEISQNPLAALQVWKGGMASHGGILGLVAFTYYYARKHKLSWTSIGDSLVAVAPVGIFLVRCANFINGELWGKPSNVPWAVQFPGELDPDARSAFGSLSDPAVQARLREILPSRHPSQIYEALLEGALLFGILWFMRTRLRLPRGIMTGAFFILYAVLRIIGETFREPDPAWSVGSISAGQFLSLFLFLLGAGFLWWGWKTQQYERIFTEPSQKAHLV